MSDSRIVRRPLRDDVRDAIMSRLVRGLHPSGSRIHEGQLAAELGVSRTPVREALMNLQQQGVLEVRPNSGFYVVPITATDIEEVYPMIGALESLAVRLTRSTISGTSCRAGRLAAEMGTTIERPKREEELDNAWHALLVSRCGNSRLIMTIQELKIVVSRYESGFMTDPESVRTSAEQHRVVVEALVAGDPFESGGPRRRKLGVRHAPLARLARPSPRRAPGLTSAPGLVARPFDPQKLVPTAAARLEASCPSIAGAEHLPRERGDRVPLPHVRHRYSCAWYQESKLAVSSSNSNTPSGHPGRPSPFRPRIRQSPRRLPPAGSPPR